MLTSLTISKNSTHLVKTIAIQPSSFSLLKGIAKSFERTVWHSLTIFYKPAVATTFGGLIAYGIDWSSKVGTDADRTKVCSLTPVLTHAAWMDSERAPLRVPKKLLQSRRFYINGADADDAGPGNIVVSIDITASSADVVVGELWCQYDVEMTGTVVP